MLYQDTVQTTFFLPPYRLEPNYTTSSGKTSGKEIPIGISYREFTIGTFV